MLLAGFDTAMAQAWDPVQAGIGAFSRVCAYDRLGVGGSGKPPKSQTFEDMAQTLDGVITELKLERPVVLVAHSLGGMVAATWAAAHPKDVAGIVMVDATGPGYPQRLLELLPRAAAPRVPSCATASRACCVRRGTRSTSTAAGRSTRSTSSRRSSACR